MNHTGCTRFFDLVSGAPTNTTRPPGFSASAIFAESFGKDAQFAQFYRSLDAYRATFRSKSDVMVIDESNEFFKAMRGQGGVGSGASGQASPRR